MRYYLDPFGFGSSFLNRINLNSASLNDSRTGFPHESIVLGRNEFTGLSDTACPNFQYVSRRHLQINCRFGKVFIQPLASQEGVVYVNGRPCTNDEIELHENDCFSLLGIKQFYNYTLKSENGTSQLSSQNGVVNSLATNNRKEVIISSNSSGTSSDGENRSNNRLTLTLNLPSQPNSALRTTQSLGKTANPSPAASLEIVELDGGSADVIVPAASVQPTPPVVPAVDHAAVEKKIMKVVVGKLLRQYECSICYETLACAVSLTPCGCCFCYDCIAGWATENKKTGSTGGEAAVECPLCMAGFTLSAALPNRTVDSAIREVLVNLPEELTAWEERLRIGTERRRTLETPISSKSSTSSLVALASAPAFAPAPPLRAHPVGRGRNEVVELLDSQPVEPFYIGNTASRPTGIQAYFGARNAPTVAPNGVPYAQVAANIPNVSTTNIMTSARKRGRGVRNHLDDEDDREFKQAINNLPAPPAARAASSSSIGWGRQGAGSGSAVCDLTATASPPNGRRGAPAVMQAVGAPPPATARAMDYYCIVYVTELPPQRSAVCCGCFEPYRQRRCTVGVLSSHMGPPVTKPTSKQQWLQICTMWCCSHCVMHMNMRRRNGQSSLWPITFSDLEFREMLTPADRQSWTVMLSACT